MNVSEYLDDKVQIDMSKVFLDLKEKFSTISDVYVVPTVHLSDEYRDSLNIAIELSAFSVLSYTAWALRTSKSVMYLWTDNKERNKFWPAKVTRLLIALGRISCDTNGLNIWIRSYGRLFHINHFIYSPQSVKLYKIIPGSLVRLER